MRWQAGIQGNGRGTRLALDHSGLASAGGGTGRTPAARAGAPVVLQQVASTGWPSQGVSVRNAFMSDFMPPKSYMRRV